MGQVVMAAFLGQVGGGEVHRDALEGQRQADGGQRRTHPLAAFAHRLVGQPDNGHQPVAAIADMDLHIHLAGLDALECDGINMGDGHGVVARLIEKAADATRRT